MVQFNTLYNVVLNYASVDKIMESDHSNRRLRAVSLFSWSVEQNARNTQMTTRVTEGARRERPLPRSRSRTRALPLLNLKKKSLLAVYSNWSYWAVLSCDTIYYAVQCGSNLCVCGSNHEVWPFKLKLRSSTFLWHCLLRCIRWFSVHLVWVFKGRSKSVIIFMQATEQYSPVVLFLCCETRMPKRAERTKRGSIICRSSICESQVQSSF